MRYNAEQRAAMKDSIESKAVQNYKSIQKIDFSVDDEVSKLGATTSYYTHDPVEKKNSLVKRTVKLTLRERFDEGMNYILGRPSKLIHKYDVSQCFFGCRDIRQSMHELQCTISQLEDDDISPWSIRDAKILFMSLRNLQEQIDK